MNAKFLRLLVDELRAATETSAELVERDGYEMDYVLAISASSAALVFGTLADCIEKAMNKCDQVAK